MDRAQRLQLAFDIARKLHEHYSHRVLAIGIYGSVAGGNDRPYSDIDLHCVLHGGDYETRLVWSAGPWKAEVNVLSEHLALERAGAVDVDWPWTQSALTQVLPVYDPCGFFARLRVVALSQPDSAFQDALLDVIVGEIYERVGEARNALEEEMTTGLALVIAELAKFGACLIGLDARHVYSQPSAALSESLSIPGRPAGYDRLVELINAGELGNRVAIGDAVDSFWLGVEMWAAERSIGIERQLTEILLAAPKPPEVKTQLDRAVTFVRTRGTQLDRVRLRNALGEPVALAEAEAAVAAHQLPDGGLSAQSLTSSSECSASLAGTLDCLRWLRELGLHGRSQMLRTLDFLSAAQDADGSFFDKRRKRDSPAQNWLGRDALVDRFFYTVGVPMRLYELGYAQHPLIRPALNWLRRHWSDWDIVAGSRYNLWALLCVSRVPIGLSGSMFQRCYATALDWISGLPAGPLTWLLDGLEGAGFGIEEPLVGTALDRLASLQDKDGIWQDSRSAVDTTITAISIFRRFGVPLSR
jgi:kanamycin nucleotidyltransferase